jgi:hypothetical protein
MSNTTAQVLFRKYEVNAVVFWQNKTTAQFYLENRKSPPSRFGKTKRQRSFI